MVFFCSEIYSGGEENVHIIITKRSELNKPPPPPTENRKVEQCEERCPNPRPQVWAGQATSTRYQRRAGQASSNVQMYPSSFSLVSSHSNRSFSAPPQRQSAKDFEDWITLQQKPE